MGIPMKILALVVITAAVLHAAPNMSHDKRKREIVYFGVQNVNDNGQSSGYADGMEGPNISCIRSAKMNFSTDASSHSNSEGHNMQNKTDKKISLNKSKKTDKKQHNQTGNNYSDFSQSALNTSTSKPATTLDSMKTQYYSGRSDKKGKHGNAGTTESNKQGNTDKKRRESTEYKQTGQTYAKSVHKVETTKSKERQTGNIDELTTGMMKQNKTALQEKDCPCKDKRAKNRSTPTKV